MEPRIDVVVIGLNSARTLADCLQSVRNSRYPQDKIALIYADGGSKDGSQEIARNLGATVLQVISDSPSPGRQRNAGWESGTGDLVQFMDSDTVMDPEWLAAGVASLKDGVGAVSGDVRERYPEKSLFNWLADLDWNGPAGEADVFGGIVLVDRKALAATGGYNLDLIAGEDPECAHRVKEVGFRILKLAVPMVLHDIAMYKVKQYWKRCYRTGHAFAEVHSMHRNFWGAEVKRIVVKGVCFVAALLALAVGALVPWALVVTLLGGAFFLRPRLLLAGRFKREKGLNSREARLYAWHVTLAVVPQFFGVLRFWRGRLFHSPLTNKKFKVA